MSRPKSQPAIPNKTELFCTSCQRWKPRAAIVAVKWIRNGQQAQYICQTCRDRVATAGARPRRGG